jgi:hypothetical protein
MNNNDEGSNENSINNIDIMTITITTVIIIQYVFVYIFTQKLNGLVQNRQEYTKNEVNTYKKTMIKYQPNTRRNKSKILHLISDK